MVCCVVVIYLGRELTVDLCDTEEEMKNMTVLHLNERIKERIDSENPVNVCAKTLRLYFEGRVLERDSTLLSQCGIQHMSTIQTHVDLISVEVKTITFTVETQSLILDDKKDDKWRKKSINRLADF